MRDRLKALAPALAVSRSELCLWALIGLGAALRIAQYLANRSLWIDECFLALNIFAKSTAQLFGPLDFNQAAPFGFLVVQRLAYRWGGPSEFALRVFPLLGGIASLWFFKRIAEQCLNRSAVPIALGLFALCDHLIYYASEAKQYSTDVVAALLCYLLYLRASNARDSLAWALFLGLLGGVVLWFSHPALFVLLGSAAALTYRALARRRAGWRSLGLLPVVFCCWALSFALFHGLCLRHLERNTFLRAFWGFAFMPLPPKTLSDAEWFIGTAKELLREALGATALPMPLVALTVGSLSLAQRKPDWFLALAIPGLAALAASGLHKYPFSGRLILFLVPSILLLVAQGASLVIETIPIPGFPSLVLAVLFVPLAVDAARYVAEPRRRSELRPLVAYLEEHRQAGDTLYVSWYAQFPFRYYSIRQGRRAEGYLTSPLHEGNELAFRHSLEALAGKQRVWILWGGVADWWEADVLPSYQVERTALERYLDAAGRRIVSMESKGAVAFLYDLSAPPSRVRGVRKRSE